MDKIMRISKQRGRFKEEYFYKKVKEMFLEEEKQRMPIAQRLPWTTEYPEVDRRYKQYYHQMQIIVSSFDAIAGPSAAKPYTALALQSILLHFRCLRDAISGQIQSTQKIFGEQESSSTKGCGISCLRYIDQHLRQQRAMQQLGMMQPYAWRPQRGLPETSVSVLRAWLFEHFLHPYLNDSEKLMLARQTGLTRGQVSNWFINARVRLWKPMVEEMYNEEFGILYFKIALMTPSFGFLLILGILAFWFHMHKFI